MPPQDPVKPNTDVATNTEQEFEAEREVRCRRCRAVVSAERHAFPFRASASVQVFPNPLGQMKKIRTFRVAQNLVPVGESTGDFTWFDGYAWTIVLCAQCDAHLGWRFDAPAGAPPHFFGLLVAALVE